MTDRYILDGHKPVPCPDLHKWALWFGDGGNRVVKQETVGDYWVSTVFLGIDHRMGRPGPPLLFETMTFDRDRDEIDCERTSSWNEAEAAHHRAIGHLRESGA